MKKLCFCAWFSLLELTRQTSLISGLCAACVSLSANIYIYINFAALNTARSIAVCFLSFAFFLLFFNLAARFKQKPSF